MERGINIGLERKGIKKNFFYEVQNQQPANNLRK